MTYHLRARHYADRHWRSFRAQVAGWLAEWRPTTTHLIIFGSSAGYTLNVEFLRRFRRVSIIEPDAFARFLFKQRFSQIGADVLPATHLLKNLDPGEWREFARAHPESSFLFSNVVGQLAFVKTRTSESVEKRVTRLFEILSEMALPWASYHDLLSVNSAPSSTLPLIMIKGKDTLASIAEEKFGKGANNVKIIDHGTLDATFALEDQIPCAWWEIEPLRYHLIGWLVGAR